jgi:hypothetical protein
MLAIFNAVEDCLGAAGFEGLVYKCIPHIYHISPAEEDAYALFVRGARLFRRDVSTAVDCRRPLPYQERRRRRLQKARAEGLRVAETNAYRAFWPILEANLAARHGVRPVHTAAEIEMLAGRFPDHIKLFGAWAGADLLRAWWCI